MTNNPASGNPQALSAFGMLPPMPANWAITETVEDALFAFNITDNEADIACFDGQSGAGKTSTASWAARQSHRDWRYCTLPLNGNRKDLLSVVYRAVFRIERVPSADHMFNSLIHRLSVGDIGIIADEAHHLGLRGVQHLRYLWDGVVNRGSRFPMLLVGCDVEPAIESATEVRRRIRRWVHFDEALSDETAVLIASTMHPRLAVTKRELIHRMNNRLAGASIGGWENIAIHIDYLTATPTSGKAQPLTAKDAERIARILHGGAAA
ncbi:ATP-binding protein [Nocardioides panacis]|uniref:ATP-binding protein n=1 Tax=Nocardioides panacis TaxID=2849501 RepID=A0A975XZX0_9ACTN|nr:ATP-binding protein [Nocardioides panacis]QWZ07714.1 ATP-binding protein [Nocardioides panacis]